jgi:hypothetical protein
MHITIQDYTASHLDQRPREVCFCAASFYDKEGNLQSVKVCVKLPTGEAGKMIKRIKQRGGIGGTDENGILRFVTWPPAVIEVRDL